MSISFCTSADWLFGKKWLWPIEMFGCERAAYILFQLGTLQVGCKFCLFFFKMDLNSCSQLQNKNASFSAFHSIFNFLELGRELKHQKIQWNQNVSEKHFDIVKNPFFFFFWLEEIFGRKHLPQLCSPWEQRAINSAALCYELMSSLHHLQQRRGEKISPPPVSWFVSHPHWGIASEFSVFSWASFLRISC